MPSVLAQRAASEGPRWTRAVEGNPLAPPFENGKEVRVGKLMLALHEEIWRESYY